MEPPDQGLVPTCSRWITIQPKDGGPTSVHAGIRCAVARPWTVSMPGRFRASAIALGTMIHGERGDPYRWKNLAGMDHDPVPTSIDWAPH